jgi:hypothetical protein
VTLTGNVRVATAALLGTAMVAATVMVPAATRRDAATAAACTTVAATQSAAMAMADACDQPVVVDSSRTEFAQVTAQPDGRLTFESYSVPQRVRKNHAWTNVDLKLTRGADGRWRPGASVADVSFSGGGTGTFASLVRGGRSLTLSWPIGALPTPTASADSLTYANVMSGVDLVVRATRTGFAHTLVVKTAAAAASPAVREIRFTLGGDAVVRRGPDGLLRAVTKEEAMVAQAQPAVAWDSKMDATVNAQATGARSTAAAPSDVARVATVTTQVTGTSLVLRPDPALLASPDLPIYVDPPWSAPLSKWAYSTNNGSTNETSVARVGRSPTSGAIYRSYFEFPMVSNGVWLHGKHIQSARVQMLLDHSYACGPTVSTMYLTPAINAVPRANWNSMSLMALLAEATGNANDAGGCNPIQPDQWMHFQGAGLTAQIQHAATYNWTGITMGFTARDRNGAGESTQGRWKKFWPQHAALFVDYDSIPGPPADMQVAGVACPASGVLAVGTTTPTFSAVLPDADSQTITGHFEWVEVPPSGNPDQATTFNPVVPSPTATANTRAVTGPVTLAEGKTYAVHAVAQDPAPYSKYGPWAGWCKFTIDIRVPDPPTITAGGTTGPGRPVTFTISTPETAVTKFRYGWSSEPATEVAATGAGPKTASVTLIVPRFGKNTLWARAIDATGNLGTLSSREIVVGRPSPPIARWGLETYPGVNQAAALADQQPALVGDTPLTPSGLTWASDVRLVGGQTATLNGTGSEALTGSAVVNTAGSFSVAAWLRPSMLDPAGDRNALGQDYAMTADPTKAGGFYLGMRHGGSDARWSFQMHDTPDKFSASRPIFAATPLTAADVGRWTHIAGVFDATEKKMRLYVNGTLAAEGDRTAAPWASTGRFTVGRTFWGGSGNFWPGQIADVQVFDRVLVPHDFTGLLASDPQSGGFHEPGILTPIQSGGWNFEAAVPCYVSDLRDTCEAPDAGTAWNRWLALTRGSAVGTGHADVDAGLWLDNLYFPEEGGTGTTEEYGRSALKKGTTPPDGGGNEYTMWEDAPVLRTDQSFTLSAWVLLGDASQIRTAVVQRGVHESAGWLKFAAGRWQFMVIYEDIPSVPGALVTSTSAAQVGVWTHLTGVYDAGRSQIRLYVNGRLEATTAVTFTPMASSGPLLVGRAWFHDQYVDRWVGGVDDVTAYQGALNDTMVLALYSSQVPARLGTNALHEGQRLTGDQYLRSNVGGYELWMQNDGNLVLYQAGVALWSTNTWGNPGASALFQDDGNLVVYRGDGTPLWSTNTSGTAAERLVVQDDGDLVLLGPGGQVLWRR